MSTGKKPSSSTPDRHVSRRPANLARVLRSAPPGTVPIMPSGSSGGVDGAGRSAPFSPSHFERHTNPGPAAMPDPDKIIATVRRAIGLFRATPGRTGGVVALEP